MSEYDFEGERNRAIVEDFGIAPVGTAPFCEATLAALRRAYAAGKAAGGGSDLDRLVALAAGVEASTAGTRLVNAEAIALRAADLLQALKAQAVKP